VAEPGFGVGADFVAATALTNILLQALAAPDKAKQFPFGLVRDAAISAAHDLDRFFTAEVSGVGATFTGATILSTGIYAPYAAFFGDWMTLADAPDGCFWDDGADPGADAILMAWLRRDGVWEQRRTEDRTAASRATPFEATEADLIFAACLTGPIEGVVNLTLNAYVALGAGYDDGRSVTVRVTGLAADVRLPARIALMAGALGLLGGCRAAAASDAPHA
jgi:hypothetical protein